MVVISITIYWEESVVELKEIGACACVVIGGVAYSVSSGGLKDALSSDIRNVNEFSYEERSEYMNEVISEFSALFESYIVQTETFDYVGVSHFSASPSNATFVEVVTSQESVPRDEVPKIQVQAGTGFCEQDEMTMFTENGWNYQFTLTDGDGRDVFAVVCQPVGAAPEKVATTLKIRS